MRTRPQYQFPYLKIYFDQRDGKRYVQFRKRGHKQVVLPQPIGSAEFHAAYNAALKGKLAIGEAQTIAGSVSAAIAAYYGSQLWTGSSPGTQAMRRAILERFRERYGTWPLKQITGNFVEAYLDSLKPHAARNHLKALRGLLKHAKHDVTRGIALPKAKSTKHESWPDTVCAQYRATHPIGSKPRLAFELAYHTGAARSELCRLGPEHVVRDQIIIGRQKTGVVAVIDMEPELRAVIDATPLTGLKTYLISKSGKAYRPNDLSDEFRHWCDQAGIDPKYSLHGLRHRRGDTMAEALCTPNEIAGGLGHASAKTALYYTQGADRARLARSTAAKLADSSTDWQQAVSGKNPSQTLSQAAAKPKNLTDQKDAC
jgi:integrase